MTKILSRRAPGGARSAKIMVSAAPCDATTRSDVASDRYPEPHQTIHFLMISHSENKISVISISHYSQAHLHASRLRASADWWKMPSKTVEIRVQRKKPHGLSTIFVAPEMGGAPLMRYFLDAYFSNVLEGVFHPFLSRSPLYLPFTS